MSKAGELTAIIAEGINFVGFDIYYDHGDSANENVGKIVSTLQYPYEREDELSQLDIAIVEKDTGSKKKAVVLVEIEETSDRPKTFLGDIFGVLFGKHICFKKDNLEIGKFTTLMVVGISKSKNEHTTRIEYIEKQANQIMASLNTDNAKIGKVMVKVYQDEDDMLKNLPSELQLYTGV